MVGLGGGAISYEPVPLYTLSSQRPSSPRAHIRERVIGALPLGPVDRSDGLRCLPRLPHPTVDHTARFKSQLALRKLTPKVIFDTHLITRLPDSGRPGRYVVHSVGCMLSSPHVHIQGRSVSNRCTHTIQTANPTPPGASRPGSCNNSRTAT